MLQDLSARFSKVIEQKRLKEKLERDLHTVAMDLQESSARLASLGTQLEKEKVDVEKLEQMSLTSLFHSVLGNREQQLEKERQELLSAQLRYQQTGKQVQFLEAEKETLLHKLAVLRDVDAEYELLLTEKDRLLRQSNQTVAQQLVELSEQQANLNEELREITEAITAGNNVVSDLEQAIQSLEHAENWGTWDMLGGGMISGAIKHSHIDEARNGIDRAQAKISQFQRELADVREQIEIQINVGELDSFVDFFFDGLIVDWIVQSKIEDSLMQARKAKDIVVQAVTELKNLATITENKRTDLQIKRASLIEST